MIDYTSTINYLYSQLPMFSVVGAGAYKPGLQTAYTLSEAFDNPHEKIRAIHVAGTNGKGSTSHMLASVLMAAGYNVGLYTSPHIFDFRERIRVNGEKISENAVVDFVNRYLGMSFDCSPTFFELTTIMAFEYFQKMGVDIAVIETGLGGRLDTTNIIVPELSIITNVSLDHMAQLGNTEVEIASEKAGIIKGGVPVVVGHATDNVREVFETKAKDCVSDITFAEDTPIVYVDTPQGRFYSTCDTDEACVKCDLTGNFQLENVNTVMHTLKILGITDIDIIKSGLSDVSGKTGLIGRWTTLQHNPDIIFDTGHNIGAWKYLSPQLCTIANNNKLHVVLGFVEDKDINPIFALLPKNAIYYLVAPETKRARSAQSLKALADKYDLKGFAYMSASEGFQAAIDMASVDDVIFVGGSNYLIDSIPQIKQELLNID